MKSTLCQIENIKMANYLQGLTATEATDFSQTSFPSALKTSSGEWAKIDAERAYLW